MDLKKRSCFSVLNSFFPISLPPLLSLLRLLSAGVALQRRLKQVLPIYIGQCLMNVLRATRQQDDKHCSIVIISCAAVVPTSNGTCLREDAVCSWCFPMCLVNLAGDLSSHCNKSAANSTSGSDVFPFHCFYWQHGSMCIYGERNVIDWQKLRFCRCLL